jgi:hypothetical protein
MWIYCSLTNYTPTLREAERIACHTREHFDAMVREILDDTFALFTLSSFRKSLARGAGNRPPPIARLEFLRSRIAVLEETVQTIARAPRQTLTTAQCARCRRRARHSGGPRSRAIASGTNGPLPR